PIDNGIFASVLDRSIRDSFPTASSAARNAASNAEPAANSPPGRLPINSTFHSSFPLLRSLALSISSRTPAAMHSRSAASSRVISSSASERKSTFNFASCGIEFTDVPPSICPRLNVVRGAVGTLVLMNRTAPCTTALIGFTIPKSDQLCPPGPVQHHHRPQLRPVSINQLAHPPQIPFAFFSHVRRKQNCPLRPYLRHAHRASQRHQRRQSRAIIRNPRRHHALAFARHLDFRSRRKHRVQVRRHQHNFLLIRARQLPDHISNFVAVDLQPLIRKQRFHRRRPLLFLKRGRRNLRQAHLFVIDPFQVFLKPVQRSAYRRLFHQGDRSIRSCHLGKHRGANRHAQKNNPNRHPFHRSFVQSHSPLPHSPIPSVSHMPKSHLRFTSSPVAHPFTCSSSLHL